MGTIAARLDGNLIFSESGITQYMPRSTYRNKNPDDQHDVYNSLKRLGCKICEMNLPKKFEIRVEFSELNGILRSSPLVTFNKHDQIRYYGLPESSRTRMYGKRIQTLSCTVSQDGNTVIAKYRPKTSKTLDRKHLFTYNAKIINNAQVCVVSKGPLNEDGNKVQLDVKINNLLYAINPNERKLICKKTKQEEKFVNQDDFFDKLEENIG